ncbi:hypothetical protein Droror1_Dr00004967 [Drosera rotundifolia]
MHHKQLDSAMSPRGLLLKRKEFLLFFSLLSPQVEMTIKDQFFYSEHLRCKFFNLRVRKGKLGFVGYKLTRIGVFVPMWCRCGPPELHPGLGTPIFSFHLRVFSK